MTVFKNVDFIQAANCHLCVQIGTTAFIFGDRGGQGYGARLELFTPNHKIRFRRWSR